MEEINLVSKIFLHADQSSWTIVYPQKRCTTDPDDPKESDGLHSRDCPAAVPSSVIILGRDYLGLIRSAIIRSSQMGSIIGRDYPFCESSSMLTSQYGPRYIPRGDVPQILRIPNEFYGLYSRDPAIAVQSSGIILGRDKPSPSYKCVSCHTTVTPGFNHRKRLTQLPILLCLLLVSDR